MSEAGGEGETPADAALRTPAKRSWLRAAADRLPTKWIASIGTALFLLATAAFGGLQAVAETPPPEIAAGETFPGAAMAFTPTAMHLSNDTSGLGISLGDDEELLVLLVDVVNTDIEPRLSTATGSVSATRLAALEELVPAVYRADDNTLSPWLQPHVPAPLKLVWVVPLSHFALDEEVPVRLPESTKHEAGFVQSGTYWSDVRLGATTTLPIAWRVHLEEE